LRAARLLAALAVALVASSALGQAIPPYKMVDSGFPVDVTGKADIQWMDADRVLFRGVVLGASRNGYSVAAHVWDTKQNKVERYTGQVPRVEEPTPPESIAASIPRLAGPVEVHYIPWANQYLVIGNPGGDAKVVPAWYVRRDGSTTEVKWPAGEWQAASNYLPTRRGLLVWAKTGSPAVYGHFLLTGGVATRIAPGFYWKGESVSPDGCKVAFRHALNREDEAKGYREWKAGRPANTLRMIDVCAPHSRAASSVSPR